MSYRSIVVHLDDSPRCAARAAVAARLARRLGAHLYGLAPTGLINVPARVTPPAGAPNPLELAQAGRNARAQTCVREFVQRVRADGLASVDGRIDEDDTVPAMLRAATVHDLVVVGQTDRRDSASTIDLDLAEQTLMHGSAPTLIVPCAGTFEHVGECVVIAWSGTRESARAVRDALPLLQKAGRVHLMCFERPRDLHHLSRLELNDARAWLARHGVQADVHQEAVRADIGEALLSRSASLAADLIVMGGYGHSRVAEFLLGGVTRRLLGQMTMPVLMAH